MVLREGDVAPGFVVKREDGVEEQSASYVGSKNVVLYFYPKDDTPGCTKEAEAFRDAHDKFAGLDTVVLGVSGDGASSHANFKKKYQLQFELISDVDTSLCREYGVWVEKSKFGKSYMGIERSTFLIDKQGRVRKLWRRVQVDGHVDAVLGAVRSLESTETT
ncbi:MAG: peroxiredoxin [Anaplasma sp.]